MRWAFRMSQLSCLVVGHACGVRPTECFFPLAPSRSREGRGGEEVRRCIHRPPYIFPLPSRERVRVRVRGRNGSAHTAGTFLFLTSARRQLSDDFGRSQMSPSHHRRCRDFKRANSARDFIEHAIYKFMRVFGTEHLAQFNRFVDDDSPRHFRAIPQFITADQ